MVAAAKRDRGNFCPSTFFQAKNKISKKRIYRPPPPLSFLTNKLEIERGEERKKKEFLVLFWKRKKERNMAM